MVVPGWSPREKMDMILFIDRERFGLCLDLSDEEATVVFTHVSCVVGSHFTALMKKFSECQMKAMAA